MKHKKLSTRILSPKFDNSIKKSATMILAAIMATALSACGSSGASSTAASTATQPSSATESTASAASSTAPTGETGKKIRMGMLVTNSVEDAALSSWSPLGPEVSENMFEYIQFPSLSAMLLELEAGKIDCIASLSYSTGKYLAASNNQLKISNPRTHGASDFYMATLAENATLSEELDGAINALKADGTIAKLAQEYLGDDAREPAPITLIKKDGGETHKVAITGDLPPLDYIAADGTPAGFNVALLNAISEKTGCNFEIVQVESSARLTALKSGKVDLVFWMNCPPVDDPIPAVEGIALTSSYYSDLLCGVAYSQEKLDEADKIVVETLAKTAASSTAS